VATPAWKLGDGSLEKAWTSREMVAPLTPLVVNGAVFAMSSAENGEGDVVRAGRQDGERAVEQREHDHVVRAQRGERGRQPDVCADLRWHVVGGKAEMVKVCSGCHELERSAAMRQDRDGWKATVDKMVALGAKGSEAEINATIDYLARTFPAEEVPKLNVNQATQIELESRLSLRRSEAAAVVKHRCPNRDPEWCARSAQQTIRLPGRSPFDPMGDFGKRRLRQSQQVHMIGH
jgi:hypothetical protein